VAFFWHKAPPPRKKKSAGRHFFARNNATPVSRVVCCYIHGSYIVGALRLLLF
jgi:hypothetical protein